MANGKHLGFKERIIIQTEIEHNPSSSCQSIARIVGCNPSSIYREIKGNSLVYKSKQEFFQHSESLPCPVLRAFPFSCNRCTHRVRCSRKVVLYDAYEAESGSRQDLAEARSHPLISSHALSELDHRVSQRVIDGQSLYHIKQTDPRIAVSEATLRRYIGKGYFVCRNIDLPRAVRFKPSKKYDNRRKRIDVAILRNRMYSDFLDFIRANPGAPVLEMDTVFGARADSKCLLTFFERKSRFQWAALVNQREDSVNAALAQAIAALLEHVGTLFFAAVLLDNGREFQGIPRLEVDPQGVFLFRTFYCDPYRSGQKGGCEKNHEFIRYAYKKGESVESLTQEKLSLLCSQFNSLRRRSLNGQSSYQAFSCLYGTATPRILGIEEVDPSKIIINRKR